MTIPVVDRVKKGCDELDQKVLDQAEEMQRDMDVLALNPVWGMLKKPRHTLREIERINYPIKWPLLLICLSGVAQSLNNFIYFPGQSDWTHVAMLITAGGLGGFLLAVLASALLAKLGRLVGGRGAFKGVLIAWGWSCVPSILIAGIWGLRYAIVGPDYFTLNADGHDRAHILDRLLVYLFFAQIVFVVWQLCLTLIAISEVHNISKRRAALAFILSLLTVGIVSAVFTILLSL